MENDTPSLPANYVTLAQLEERWLKEQQRKQTEKQRQMQQQQQQEDLEREKTERDRKDGEDDVKNRVQNGTTKVDVAAPTTITHFRNRRYQNRRNGQESQIQAPVVDDVAQRADESKQQEEKKKKKKSGKPSWKKKRDESRAARLGAGETVEVQPPEEEVEKVVPEKAREVEGAKRKIQINGNGSGRKGSQLIEKEKEKVVGDNTAPPIVQNFEGLSVNGGTEGNVRPREGRNGRNGGYGRDSGRFHARGERQQQGKRDGNLVWVKKGESTDAGVNGFQC